MSDVKMLRVEGLTKSYPSGDRQITVLDSVSFEIEAGTTTAIIGPSGSGKTTLLGLCAGLDQPSEGAVFLEGKQLSALSEDDRAILRRERVGFVFQNFQLLPTLTARENVMVPLELQGKKTAAERADFWLERVGLKGRGHHYPSQLSGGEQQRIALARAFVHDPVLLFADEPTGNLDGATSDKVEQLLFDLHQESGTTLVLVTHDQELAQKTQRIISLKSGQLLSDSASPSQTDS